MNPDQLQPSFNMVKESFVDALVKEGFLQQEQGELIKASYAVTLQKKGWLGRIISKLLWKEDGSDKDQMKVVVVKIVN